MADDALHNHLIYASVRSSDTCSFLYREKLGQLHSIPEHNLAYVRTGTERSNQEAAICAV